MARFLAEFGQFATNADRLGVGRAKSGLEGGHGFFAFFHGHAHGGELGEAGAASFAIGFMLATAVLHAVGIGLGISFGKLQGGDGKSWLTRAAGAVTAAAGLLLAFAG